VLLAFGVPKLLRGRPTSATEAVPKPDLAGAAARPAGTAARPMGG
jgi:hypothetical protein